MSKTNASLIGRIRHLAVAGSDAPTAADHDLLRRYVSTQDETAFSALVKRHSGLVLGTCCRILRQRQDAEDAFQAVFLVLARKASSIRRGESVAGWLHSVAIRAAQKLRAAKARRLTRETAAAAASPTATADNLGWQDTQRVLEEELNRLSDKYRAPILLCCVQGRTRDEAAQQLGWSLGELRGRLDRGRELLRNRLTRRGLSLSAVLLVLGVTQTGQAAMVPALVSATVQAATGAAHCPVAVGALSAQAVSLAQGVIQAMFLTKLKFVAVGLLTVAFLATGAGVVTHQALAQEGAAEAGSAPVRIPMAQQPAKKKADPADLKREVERLKLELEQTRVLLQAANKEILELRAVKAKAADLEKLNRNLAAEAAAQADVARKAALQALEQERRAREEAARAEAELARAQAARAAALLAAEQEAVARAAAAKALQGKAGLDVAGPIAIAPNGKLLVSASGKTLSILDAATQKTIARCEGHSDMITGVAISPDARIVISGGRDKNVMAWELATGKAMWKSTLQNPVSGVAISPDGKLVLAQEGGQATEFDMATGKIVRVIKVNPK